MHTSARTAGRLTIVEFEERTAGTLAARTRGDLDDLTSDLPPVVTGDATGPGDTGATDAS